ncbi:hypothetical protein K474DRAFT_587225 [Panus rudis PR-1116 ss-1]|nr:hypothetical protein K474DRAFT_587225 [Panus rudis PR-1116 ss-1]
MSITAIHTMSLTGCLHVRINHLPDTQDAETLISLPSVPFSPPISSHPYPAYMVQPHRPNATIQDGTTGTSSRRRPRPESLSDAENDARPPRKARRTATIVAPKPRPVFKTAKGGVNPKPKATGGRKKNSRGYNVSDELALAKLVLKHIPQSSNDWDVVGEDYNKAADGEGRSGERDATSLKKKFYRVCPMFFLLFSPLS